MIARSRSTIVVVSYVDWTVRLRPDFDTSAMFLVVFVLTNINSWGVIYFFTFQMEVLECLLLNVSEPHVVAYGDASTGFNPIDRLSQLVITRYFVFDHELDSHSEEVA